MTDSAEHSPGPEPATAERERDFYLRLLKLGQNDDIDTFLQDALALSVELAAAERGYLEIGSETARDGTAGFVMTRGFSDNEIQDLRGRLSRGVIAEAIATGKTVITASALSDSRFKDRKSVQRNAIEAVLCSPIGSAPPLGVLYLQGRKRPGPFTEADRERAEMLAHHIVPFVDRLLLRRRQDDETDPTKAHRAKLQASEIIGRSDALARVLRDAAVAAPLDVTVLLLGPSGAGKTQLARVIHKNSPRAKGPFVELNCAGIPENLIESELFGALPGSYTGATRHAEGKVGAANGGTLFLDEIGDLSPAGQSALLTFIESRQYFQLGASKPTTANVRIIAATNADLSAAVKAQQFRKDLYYRLHFMPITLPSLAERPEDVADIARTVCARAVETHGLRAVRLSPGALRALSVAEWPGNVRELAHVVEVAAIRASSEELLQVEARHLFPDQSAAAELTKSARNTDPPPGETGTFQEETRRFQKQLVQRVLEDCNWNIALGARRLDITRAHLYNLIRGFGLERPRL